MLTLLSGLAAGAAHVVTGPDHLAALAPIAADSPKRAAALGVRWGLGHGFGVILLGGVGVVARDAIPVELLSAWAEFLVGAILIAVGAWAFRRSGRMVIHSHDHHHGHEGEHAHLHVHASGENHDAAEAHIGHSHAAFLVGLLHGAAGTGHLFGVLPSLALPTHEAVLYLGAYFVAAVLSMGVFGALMGRLARGGGPRMMQKIMYATSTFAMGLGVIWMGQSWPFG